MTSDFNFQKAREAWGDKVVAPTHRVFQEWLHNPLTKALKESHKNDIEKLAKWMMERGFATGHGDSMEDLLHELEWQISENSKWVGLTDEEVSEIIGKEIGFNSCFGPEESFARAIEAKLKEKNQ
jgi:hypothetical protein